MAVDEGWIAANPWKGLTIKAPFQKGNKHQSTKESYQPFETHHLKRIFSHQEFDPIKISSTGNKKLYPHDYWAPLIALFTSMRMNEILQLEREDILKTEAGISYIAVTDDVKGKYKDDEFLKQLKTKNSIRQIPLHPQLIKLGFLDWVNKTASGRIFPDAKASKGQKPSDQYTTLGGTVA